MKIELLGIEISPKDNIYGFSILNIETSNWERDLFSVYFHYDWYIDIFFIRIII
jgi:hypothetical protein